MGLRSPQELKTVQTQAIPTSRVQDIPREQMSTNFLNTFAQTANRVIDAQVEEDKKMTSIVSARYRELADRERLTAEGTVASSQGWNVLNVSKDQSASLTEKLNALKGQFDERYEPYLENVRLDVLNKFTRSSQPYVINQVKKTTKETYDAVIANEMNDTILDSGDLDAFSGNLERVKGLVKEKSMVQHGEDEEAEIAPGVKLRELIDNESNAAVSKTVANSVIQLAKLGHLKNAEQLFRKHDPDMNSDDRLRAVEGLKSALNSEDSKAATALADVVQKSANDLVEAEQMISTMAVSDKQRNNALAIIKSRYDVAVKAKKKREDETTSQVYENLLGGKSLSDVSDMMKSLPVERQNEIVNTINKNNGKVIPSTTNSAKFDEAIDAIHFNSDEVVNDPGFLGRYVPHLNPSDFNFVKSQLNARKREAADKQEWIRLNAGKIVLNDVTRLNNERGVFDPATISKNKRLVLEYSDSLIAQNPKIDQLELQKKVKAWAYTNLATPEVTQRGIISRTWNKLFGDGLDYEVNYNNPQAPDAVSSSGQAITYSPEEMDAFRSQARKAFQAKGLPVNMEAIEKAMRQRMQHGQSLKVK